MKIANNLPNHDPSPLSFEEKELVIQVTHLVNTQPCELTLAFVKKAKADATSRGRFLLLSKFHNLEKNLKDVLFYAQLDADCLAACVNPDCTTGCTDCILDEDDKPGDCACDYCEGHTGDSSVCPCE